MTHYLKHVTSGVYEIAIEGDMTKEYAEELAKKFAR